MSNKNNINNNSVNKIVNNPLLNSSKTLFDTIFASNIYVL